MIFPVIFGWWVLAQDYGPFLGKDILKQFINFVGKNSLFQDRVMFLIKIKF